MPIVNAWTVSPVATDYKDINSWNSLKCMKSDPASKKFSTAMSNESEVWQGLCVEFSSGIRARAGFILKTSVVGYSSKTLCDGIP